MQLYITFLVIFLSINSQATEADLNHLLFKSPKIQLLKTIEADDSAFLSTGDCSEQSNPLSPNIDIGKIINIGKQVWTIIESNKAEVNVSSQVAYALPEGVTCWDQLENWSSPKSYLYQITYENFFGIKVVEFKFRVSFAYNGQFKTKGKYLTNVTILPIQVDASWGYKFNAKVSVSSVINLSTVDHPLAGMELGISWQVSTALKTSQAAKSFFVQGDGEYFTLDYLK